MIGWVGADCGDCDGGVNCLGYVAETAGKLVVQESPIGA